MGDIEKRLNISALKKATTWGTEIDPDAAGNGILPLNAGALKLGMTPIEDESATEFEQNLDLGDKDPLDFSLEFDLRYEGLENLLAAMCMGIAGDPTQQVAGVEKHVFQVKNKLTDLFVTYATEKHDKIFVVPSAKVHKLTYTVDAGKVKLTADLKGDNLINNSAIIDSISAVTVPDVHHRVLAKHCSYFRMNAQNGAALVAGDAVKLKNFTLEIERVLESGAYELGSQTIIEAGEEGKVKVTLTIDINRMDDVNDLYFAQWLAETEKKADLMFASPDLIVDPYNYYYLFQFPRLKIIDVDHADDAIIPAKVVLRGLLADTAPTGMESPDIKKQVQITILNARDTDYLT